jgi:hypothetical protein
MRRTCYVSLYEGNSFRVEFLGQYESLERMAANLICSEEDLAKVISNWVQLGVVSSEEVLR